MTQDEKQPNEDLEREIKLYQLRNPVINHQEKSLNDLVKRVAIYFTQWQKEQTINKASQWLNENVVEYHPRTGKLRPVVNINAFREAMEKQNEE